MPRLVHTLPAVLALSVLIAPSASAQNSDDLLGAFARALGAVLEESQTPQQATPESALLGEYALTSDGTGPRARTDCLITLTGERRFGQLALTRNFACQQAFNEFFHVSQWRLSGNDIVLIGAGGREEAMFRLASTGRYIADRDGVRYWLTSTAAPQLAERDRPQRRRPDPRPNFPEPTIENLAGVWRIGEANGSRECELRLNNRTSLGDYQMMTTGTGCPRIVRDFQRWNLRGDELVFVGMRERIVFRMRQTGTRRWDGEMDGEALYIAR